MFVPAEEAWYWLYLSNWSPTAGMVHTFLIHLWSLSIEEQFYVVWPILTLTLSSRSMMWVCGALIVLVPCARAICVPLLPAWKIYRLTVFRADSLALGALCAFLVRTPPALHVAERLRPFVLAGSVSGLAFALAWSRTSDPYAWLDLLRVVEIRPVPRE